MANSSQIDAIRARIRDTYNVDLSAIVEDDNKIRRKIGDDTVVPIEIYEDGTSYSYNGSSAVVPDLETFSFGDVALDQRLYTRRVEQNLEEALRFSQSCLEVRQTYMELAKLRNDTRFKLEEFIRLDLIHLQEVAAKLYELPWLEAVDEVGALTSASAEGQSRQDVVTSMMAEGGTGTAYSGILSNKSVDAYISTAAQLAQDSASFNQAAIEAGTKAETTYRAGFDLATWIVALASTKGELAQLQGRLASAKRKADYLKKDKGFRSHRAAVSRQIAYAQADELTRSHSIINYNERLNSSGDLFRRYLRCLIERVLVVKMGLKDSYKLDIPLSNPPTGDILDLLSTWLVDVQNELSKYKRSQRTVVRSVKSKAITVSGKGGFGGALDILHTEFTIDTSTIPDPNSLLRGIAFEYVGNQQNPISLTALPPAGAYIPVDRGGSPDTLQFGRVFPLTAALDLKPQHADVFWNGNPSGDWKVDGLFEQNAGTLDAIVMHLWLAEL
ncbi:hypothetical protein [Mesorhizobium sp. B2-3-10]|uniref:hypothetical protein n=1 Tax=Mesorhizobium sp. B2-3-10 TaxID=2589954 RepID=UPI00112B64E2|nr:hypothetical protein [Mesorhizobium sp. B2-3-10]TPM02116.1 hypothetical protein FJ943_08485 [Mesorhizobium sp. B2-3-10]